jgi:hydroxyacylglutathione hydrolase
MSDDKTSEVFSEVLMLIATAAAPPFFKNGFVVSCEETREGVVIDPGDEVEELLAAVARGRVSVRAILLTHAHLDHITGVARAKSSLGVPIWLHQDDLFLYDRAVEQGLMFGLTVEQPPAVDRFYEPDTPFHFGKYVVDVLPTPGHCPGGVCLAIGKVDQPGRELFVGDTLFAGSIGRTDLPGGDYATLMRSIRSVLFAFPDETIVHAGHGPDTSIGDERRTNPFLTGASSRLIGLFVQAVGALLMASLCAVLLRTVRKDPLMYWSIGWVALFTSLSWLWMSFFAPHLQWAGQTVYLLGEYAFGYLVIAGCRLYAKGERPKRREAWLLLLGLALALWLPRLGGDDFNVFFAVHTLIYAYLFFAAFRVMRHAPTNNRSVTGVRVMNVALVLLTLDYLHYAPLFALSSLQILPNTVSYLVYAPLYDLIFEFMLMFGMVMIVTGDVQHELEAANRELGAAHDRLETLAQIDHLTSALNRHAFSSLLARPRATTSVLAGCAAIVDVDDLKKLNDRHGHPVGDGAIQAVAAALRSVMRANDWLFRWGGDEFLMLLIGASDADARARLEPLNERLRQIHLPGLTMPIDVSATAGFAPFADAASLDEVIARADHAMYATKKQAV